MLYKVSIWRFEWDQKIIFLPTVVFMKCSKSAMLSGDSWTPQEPEGGWIAILGTKQVWNIGGRSYYHHTCIIMIYVELSDLDSGQPFIKSLSLQIFKNSWEYLPRGYWPMLQCILKKISLFFAKSKFFGYVSSFVSFVLCMQSFIKIGRRTDRQTLFFH